MQFPQLKHFPGKAIVFMRSPSGEILDSHGKQTPINPLIPDADEALLTQRNRDQPLHGGCSWTLTMNLNLRDRRGRRQSFISQEEWILKASSSSGMSPANHSRKLTRENRAYDLHLWICGSGLTFCSHSWRGCVRNGDILKEIRMVHQYRPESQQYLKSTFIDTWQVKTSIQKCEMRLVVFRGCPQQMLCLDTMLSRELSVTSCSAVGECVFGTRGCMTAHWPLGWVHCV